MANEKEVALVTGSNRGIGFETARQLGQQGVRVIVSARTEREAADATSKLRSEGIEAEALACGSIFMDSLRSFRGHRCGESSICQTVCCNAWR
jgi:NAD(P)-dependent dehydrogenase (short-subunit alcohol dehydrogenase family)